LNWHDYIDHVFIKRIKRKSVLLSSFN
jgi:hypothetical protein